jgi:hypothetical protein
MAARRVRRAKAPRRAPARCQPFGLDALWFLAQGVCRMRFGSDALTWLALTAFVLVPAVVRAQGPVHCDAHLLRSVAKHPLAYGPRNGDRCEGQYVREVSGGGAVLVASFIRWLETFDPTKKTQVWISWNAPADASVVRLRAFSLQPKTYYRMDTVRPERSTAYRWPTGVLASLGLTGASIGLIGWTTITVQGERREVYVPLGVGEPAEGPRPTRYTLVLLPDAELSEVYVSLAALGGDGRPGTAIKRDEPLRYGFYPAGRDVKIQLPLLRTPGLYRLEVGAQLQNGGATTTNLLFYHAGG